MFHKLFSKAEHSSTYAKYRPEPPPQLIQTIVSFLKDKRPPNSSGKWSSAVDVGCGNGQCTKLLLPYFEHLHGFDVSESQIQVAQCQGIANITYAVSPAEQIPLPDKSVDLLTASQCFHWFEMDQFYKEADRLLAVNGVLAVFGYQVPTLRPINVTVTDESKFEKLVEKSCYSSILAPHWNMDRLSILLSGYADITLPYQDFCRIEGLTAEREMNLEDLCGYLASWSGYQKCKEEEPEKIDQLVKEFLDDFSSLVKQDAQTAKVMAVFTFTLLLTRKSTQRTSQ